MNASFYTAARGAMTQQDRMNVISNNLANVNTIGFKAKNAVFSDLMHCVTVPASSWKGRRRTLRPAV